MTQQALPQPEDYADMLDHALAVGNSVTSAEMVWDRWKAAEADNERLRNLLAELLRHDEHNFGRWTMADARPTPVSVAPTPRPRGRLMSVSLTADAVIERRKTVTRRLGWRNLKPGDRLQLCRKVMGRKSGEPLERLAVVEVVDVRREPLCRMTDEDVEREAVAVIPGRFMETYDDTGQPTVDAWVQWFCEEMGVGPYDDVTRIQWRYLDA